MKKISTLLLLLVCSSGIFAQVKYESLTYEQALQKAKKNQKLLFVQLQSATCDQCNEVGEKGLSTTDVVTLLNREFIAITFKPLDPDWKVLSRQHLLSFGSLFFTASGDLLHKYTGTTSAGIMYVAELKKALEKNKDFAAYQQLEENFKQGERNLTSIKELILQKIRFSQSHDQLTTIYLSLLPADSLYTADNIAFLIKTAPMLTSRADSVMRKNYRLFDSCWNRNTLAERMLINQQIINKTRRYAVVSKNISLAYKLSAFTASTYNPNIEEGVKAGEKQLLYYFAGIKDTVRIYTGAQLYANRFLMQQSIEKVKIKDSLERVKLLKEAQPVMSKTKDGKTVYSKTITRPTSASKIAAELREMTTLMLGSTNDINKLEQIIPYIDRAIELNNDGNSYEDKAKVLQKLNRTTEAIQILEDAVTHFRLKGLSAEWLIPKIEALKNGTILTTDQQD